MPPSVDWECESIGSSSSSSSDSSLDEDQVNARLSPHWSEYRDLILSNGYRLDTVRDVREHYRRHGVGSETHVVHFSGYLPEPSTSDDTALCKDPGLVWHYPFPHLMIPKPLLARKSFPSDLLHEWHEVNGQGRQSIE